MNTVAILLFLLVATGLALLIGYYGVWFLKLSLKRIMNVSNFVLKPSSNVADVESGEEVKITGTVQPVNDESPMITALTGEEASVIRYSVMRYVHNSEGFNFWLTKYIESVVSPFQIRTDSGLVRVEGGNPVVRVTWDQAERTVSLSEDFDSTHEEFQAFAGRGYQAVQSDFDMNHESPSEMSYMEEYIQQGEEVMLVGTLDDNGEMTGEHFEMITNLTPGEILLRDGGMAVWLTVVALGSFVLVACFLYPYTFLFA